MEQSEIDGFLVGGASLDPASFAALVNLRGWK
jgi:triosephosphate isomerase